MKNRLIFFLNKNIFQVGSALWSITSCFLFSTYVFKSEFKSVRYYYIHKSSQLCITTAKSFIFIDATTMEKNVFRVIAMESKWKKIQPRGRMCDE